MPLVDSATPDFDFGEETEGLAPLAEHSAGSNVPRSAGGPLARNPTARLSKVSKKALKSFSLQDPSLLSVPTLFLDSSNDTFAAKKFELFDVVKIGRKTSPKVNAEASNGIFDSKVLSRNHAEVMNEGGKVLIRDVGSSNGTFVNGFRLSEEGKSSDWAELKAGDTLEFGIDINGEDGVLLYQKVSCKVFVELKLMTEPARAAPQISRSGSQSSQSEQALQALLATEVKKNTDTAEQLAVLKLTLKAVDDATKTVAQDQSELTAQLSEALSQNKLLKERLNSLAPILKENEALAKASAEHTKEVDALQGQLKAAQAQVSALSSEMALVTAQLKADQAQVLALSSKVASLTAQSTAQDQAMVQAKQTVQDLESQVTSLTSTARALTQELQDIKSGHASLQSTTAQDATSRHAYTLQIEQLTAALEAAQQQVAALSQARAAEHDAPTALVPSSQDPPSSSTPPTVLATPERSMSTSPSKSSLHRGKSGADVKSLSDWSDTDRNETRPAPGILVHQASALSAGSTPHSAPVDSEQSSQRRKSMFQVIKDISINIIDYGGMGIPSKLWSMGFGPKTPGGSDRTPGEGDGDEDNQDLHGLGAELGARSLSEPSLNLPMGTTARFPAKTIHQSLSKSTTIPRPAVGGESPGSSRKKRKQKQKKRKGISGDFAGTPEAFPHTSSASQQPQASLGAESDDERTHAHADTASIDFEERNSLSVASDSFSEKMVSAVGTMEEVDSPLRSALD